MQIFSSYNDGRLTLFFNGELDQHGAHDAMKTIDRLLDEYLPRDCALDMSGLTFMDSSGIALILKAYRRMQLTGGRAWVENAGGQALKVIDASGIERIMHIKLTREVCK